MPTKYQDVNSYKNSNSLVDARLVLCWPKVGLGSRVFHLSTFAAAQMALTDATHDQIPYESPSNKIIPCDKAVVDDGTPVYLSKAEANVLNSYGVVTALQFTGWRLWGSRTSIYPSSTDPKDNFVPCRRMMDWVANELTLNFFSRLDAPINKKLVNDVLNQANQWLNGLTARGALLGGQVSFRAEDNSTTDLADGKIRFHVALGLVTPARSITFTLEFDVNYLNNLFS